MGQIEKGLVLEVKLLGESSLWYWEIREDGRCVESSWANEWAAFASRPEAAAAGARRLAALTMAGSAAVANAPPRRPARRMVVEPTRRVG